MNPTISIKGEHFALAIPGSHEVLIPIDQPDKLVAVLMARRNNKLRIGEAGSPTQWQVDRDAQDIFLADQRAAALAEIGL